MKNNTDNKFQKAWDSLDGRIIDIKNLPKSRNGKNCGCTCVECNKELEACQGFVRAWYFRHQSNTACNGGPMTAIHLLAQQLLVGNHTINTQYGSIAYTEAVNEALLTGSKFRADVLGEREDGTHFIIEISVTHKLTDEKNTFLRDNKIQSVEIDLSNVSPMISEDELLEIILNDKSKQTIVYLPEIEAQRLIANVPKPHATNKTPWYEEFLPWLFILSIIGFCIYVFTGRKNPPRKRLRNRS